MINGFIQWAEDNNWNIEMSNEKACLPEHIRNRYDIPSEWYDFISQFRMISNSEDTKWFLTPDDYQPAEGGFQWNDFELQSLEYCDDKSEITAFWDRHLPIFMSVDGEYSYYAIDTENGNVVYGSEPEFEEVTFAADDFESFIRKIISEEIVL